MSGIDRGTDFPCLCELGQANGDHDHFVWAVGEDRFNTFDEFGIEFTYGDRPDRPQNSRLVACIDRAGRNVDICI
jgi:hypothetical protein